MIFLSDIQGTIKAIVPEQIYQGSSNAKEIVLIAPFPETSAVAASIRLPNGQLLVPKILIPKTPEVPFETSYKLSPLPNFSFEEDGVSLYNAWRMELNADITQYSGELSVQFLIATGNEVIETTSSENINIGKGTPYVMPENVNDWSQVLEAIQYYQATMKEDLDNLKEELNFEQGQAPNSIQQKGTGAKSLGDNCVALNEAKAGCLGYRYIALDLKNRKIYLSDVDETEYNSDGTAKIAFTTTGFTVEEIAEFTKDITLPYNVGDKFTLKTRSIDFDMVTTIKSISKNVVEYNFLNDTMGQPTIDPFADLTEADVIKKDTYVDRYSFSVPEKSDLGAVIISEDAFSVGDSENRAPGRFSVSGGRGNNSFGDGSTTFGRDCDAGYGAVSAGYGNKALGDRSGAVGGAANVVKAPFGFVTGNSNEIKAEAIAALVAGLFNIGTREAQAIVGKAAEIVGGALFTVGNGELTRNEKGQPTGVKKRSNAFVVYEDGRASVGKAPINPNDVVILDILPIRRGSAPFSIVGYYNAIAEVAGALAWGYGCRASGSTAVAWGEECIANRPFSIAVGHSVEMWARECFGFGLGLKTFFNESDDGADRHQFIVGTFNKILHGDLNSIPSDAAKFIVGNGKSDTERSNAFVVWGDGRATISKDPTEDMDVVPKHMYDALLARVQALEAKL